MVGGNFGCPSPSDAELRSGSGSDGDIVYATGKPWINVHRILGVEKTLSSLLYGNVEVINVPKTVKAFRRFSLCEFLEG
jgi:hypothetical protein